MGYIISMIFAVIVCSIAFFIGRMMSKQSERFGDSEWKESDIRTLGKVLVLAAMIVFTMWVGIHTLLASIKQVPAGHVGIVYTFADITGQKGEGLQWIFPWKQIRTESVQIQKYTTADVPRDLIQQIGGAGATAVPEGHVGCFSSDTQDVFIKGSLNFRVSKQTIQDLLRNIGPNWRDVIIAPRLVNFLKEETVVYTTVDVAPNREVIRTSVRDRLYDELDQYSIIVEDFLLDNVDFRSEFKESIENKQIAKQQALEEEARVEKERQKGLQALALAEGRAQAIMVEADAQAYANNVLADSLRGEDEVLQYKLIEQLAPGIRTIILPSGQEFLLDLSTLGGIPE